MKKIITIVVAIIAVVLFVVILKNHLLSANSAKGILHLSTWSGYSIPDVYKQFEQETGYKIVEETYTSNEELQSKLEAGAGTGNYDLICPTDYTIPQFVAKNLLAKINHANLPNLKNMEEFFLNRKFDIGNNYTVPYLWGTTGIGYNKKYVKETPDSWAILFDEAQATKYLGRTSMLDYSREAFGAALKYLGYSVNSSNPAEIQKAKELLIKQKKYIARYDDGTAADLLGAGELAVIHFYGGDVIRASAKNPDVAYVFPKEGGFLWMDNYAIAASSKNKVAAEMFLNFIMRPDIAANIVKLTKFPTPNREAKKFIAPEILNNPSIYPPDEVLARAEWTEQVSPEIMDLYEKGWQEVKNASDSSTPEYSKKDNPNSEH